MKLLARFRRELDSGPSFRSASLPLRPDRSQKVQQHAHSEFPLMKHLHLVVVILLLAFMAVLAGGAARRESITFDEVAHIGAGVSYLQKLDMRMNEEHPPLAKILAALPLVLRGVHTDYSHISWTFSGTWFGSVMGQWAWGHCVALQWNDPYSTLWWARVPMLGLTLALGVCLYLFACRLGNAWGGLLCLAAFVATPAFLVFGPLVITDIPITFFTLLTLWSFAELWRSPNRRTLWTFGLLFGATILTKFSAGLLFFCFLAFRLSLRWLPLSQQPSDKPELLAWRKLRGRYLWKGVLIAAVMVYAVYFIFTWNEPSDSLQFLGHGPASLFLRRILMPAWIFLRGLAFFAITSRRATYVLGHYYTHGIWYYFPVVFVLKSTLAFLLSLLLSLLVALVARNKLKGVQLAPAGMEFHWRAVWTFLIVFLIFCMVSPMTISIRHFTIPIVLLILLMAPLPRALALLREKGWPAARLAMGAYVLLSLASLVTMARTYPYFFPYLNSLSFGRPGYTLVNDSNLDWNQSLPDVERFVEQRGLHHVLLDEYSFIEPKVYVPQAEVWNCQLPSPADAGQWVIISLSMIVDGHNCTWLLHYPHTEIAGGSMYVLQLPNVIPPEGDPAGPPPPEAHRNLGGMPGPDNRLIFLNCIRDPKLLQPTMDNMRAQYEAEMAKRRAAREKKQKEK